MWFVGNMLLEHLYQTALAYACIPSEQEHLSVPSFDLCPAFKQYTDLLFSTDQRCESSGLSHIKAIGGTALAQDTIHGDRLTNTSECLFA
jgi:hypothetical protein